MANLRLQMKSVIKRINKETIVHPFELEIGEGQVVALCGGNGAGKSTILRMIAGIIHPTAGTISIGGLQWKQDRRKYARQIGYMPDDFNFGLALTAWETILFYAELQGAPASRAEEVLNIVGLQEVKHRSVGSYSKGMRQRLLFAQALLSKPPLLILDEPTNGLDPLWMDAFVQLVREVAAQGQTVLFSSHHLPVAEAAADSVIFLQTGRVVGAGSVEDYRKRYGAAGLNGAFSELYAFQPKKN